MTAQIIELERLRLLRRARRAECDESMLPWGAAQWPLCRIRHFVRSTASGRRPRCCCGRVYTDATLHHRAQVLTVVVRETLQQLTVREAPSVPQLVAALLVHPELTSVERAALSTGPCGACPMLAEQNQQLQFLWGLYRAYWTRAVRAPGRRAAYGSAVPEARKAAADLRRHIRHEVALIRQLQQRLAACPWARRRPLSRSATRSPGC